LFVGNTASPDTFCGVSLAGAKGGSRLVGRNRRPPVLGEYIIQSFINSFVRKLANIARSRGLSIFDPPT
jgi:hypothetical protein